MSPVDELTVGELLAFEFTRPDLTATLTVSEFATFEPTFHQHQIRPNSTTRALFNKSHEPRWNDSRRRTILEEASVCIAPWCT
ncbi:BQ5605_C001g00634 [Microbotryum silenes-dioicae]|uniref:BQ5605_C001g00634 protein n=1 Tax=Microbotryum silenes-dioicae TaxID=796604 RepID=A0A2X0MY99_9BASI|nr:BQ5605_C001g00634 [Microbotryum silenes-dioicae]